MLLLLFIPLAFSCEKEGPGSCLKGHGEMHTETRSLSGVRAIELHDHVKLRIATGSKEKMVVEAGEKLIPFVKTEMRKDTLVIRDENRCNWTRSYKKGIEVRVTVEELHALKNRSTADIHVLDTIKGQSFHYDQWQGMGDVHLKLNVDSAVLKQHTGSADLHVSGKCERADLFCAGTGFMYLQELKAGSVWAHNDATSNIELFVKDELRVRIESIGSVFYSGPGKLVSKERKGSGTVENKK